MVSRRLAAAVFLAAGLSHVDSARAEDAPPACIAPPPRYYFRLEYRVAPGLYKCPTRQDVIDVFSGQVDYNAIRDEDAPGQITIDLARKGDKIQARMVVDGAGKHWEATIAPPFSCEDTTISALTNIYAAVAVLILKPMKKALPPPVPPPPCPVVPPPVPPPPCPVAPEAAVPPPPPVVSGPRFQLGVASVFAAGTAPVVTGGVGWLIGVRWPTVSLALEGRALFAPSATLDSYGVIDKSNYVFAAASVSACSHPWAAWAFACARAEVGSLSIGVNNPKGYVTSNHVAFFGVGLRVGGEHVVLQGLAMRLYAEILAEPVPGSLAIDSNGSPRAIWPGAVVSGSLGFGPVVTFGGP